MSGKQIRALTIKVNPSSQPAGVEYKWDKLPQPEVFIKNIEIPELNSDDGTTKVNLGAIVSGIPSVFARASLFKNALDSITDNSIQAKGMLSFYKQLISEWRGFISCIALNYAEISIKRVTLQYSDGKSVSETSNIYEPTGAFGNVLFDRKPLWVDQQKTLLDPENHPFIDVISYKDTVIGGTTPESLLFTSVSYNLLEKQPYLRNGKFIDPLESELSQKELNVLFGYCKHLIKKFSVFRNHFIHIPDSDKPNYSNLINNLEDWANVGMANYARQKGWQAPTEKTPEIGIFSSPYNLIFNYSTQLFGWNGVISDDEGQMGAIAFNPEDLLLPETSQMVQIGFPNSENDPSFVKKHPLLMLRAERVDKPGQFFYFGLPLSSLALCVFDNHIEAICGLKDDSHVKSRILAYYDPTGAQEKLNVTLKIVDKLGKEFEVKRTYSIADEITGKDIVIWPDFVSRQWKRYFLYNEIPHNGVQFQATPFLGDMFDQFFRIIKGDDSSPIYIAKDGKPVKDHDKFSSNLLIESNYKVANNFKYEIYESNKPFKGIKFSLGAADNICGFAILRYDELGTTDGLPKNWLTSNNKILHEANVGIDFGSTNSSIAFYSTVYEDRINKPFVLKNRRISLLKDRKNSNEYPTVESELFFFQMDEIVTNSIKSVLTLHDPRRIANSEGLSDYLTLEKEISGGLPCFSRNLPIEKSNESRHTLNFTGGAGMTELVHNMKWSSTAVDKSHKNAFLRSLLLHVYAQLFEENHEPVTIKWSYPSSMPSSLKSDYFQIYKDLATINPLVSDKQLVIFKPSADEIDTEDRLWNAGSSNETSPLWGEDEESDSEASTQTSNNEDWDLGGAKPNVKRTSFDELKTDSEPLEFKFKVLENNESLTEASAVANYFLRDYPVRPDELLFIFDIGGSTTDLSVVCSVDDNAKGMIKQSSIRFAAQRIALATSYAKNFQNVLLRICEKKQFKVSGLHSSPSKFNEGTAPFFFEQIVDRLNDSDFGDFYQLIASECKDLMIINLYVTGLIMYYAGQLTYKIKNELDRSIDSNLSLKNKLPKINIAFAGKGARIFDWLESAVSSNTAKEYYTKMFMNGIGGLNIAKKTITPYNLSENIIININSSKKDNNADVKYEVAKGLALPTNTTKMKIPRNKPVIEILGEEGFGVYRNGELKTLQFGNSITSEMMEQIGGAFVHTASSDPNPCPKFSDFAELFYKYSESLFGLSINPKKFQEAFRNLNIESYIKQDPDYLAAKKRSESGKKFDYVAPIIILEGMKFYDKYLLDWMKNGFK